MIKVLLLSKMERLNKAVTVCSWILGSWEPSNVTRNGIASDSAIILLLSIPLFASNLSSYAAALCMPTDQWPTFQLGIRLSF